MIRLLLMSLLFVSANSYAAKVYGNLDPCIIVDNQKSCLSSATAEEIAQWDNYWMVEPYFGEDEKESLERYKNAQWADVGTTATGLLFCTAVVEANPVGVLIPVGKWLHYKHLESSAKRTPRVYSMATGINMSAATAALPAAWNIGILARCL